MKTKKMAKRLLVCVLALAIVMSMCSIFASAAGESFTISAAPAEISGGETVTLTVNVAGDLGFEAVGLDILYDTDSFAVEKYQAGIALTTAAMDAMMGGGSATPTNGAKADKSGYAFGFMSEGYTFTPSGILFTLKLKAATDIKPGTYDFKLAVQDGNTVPSSLKLTAGKAATVTVKADTVDVSSVTLNKTSLSLEEGASETLTATVKPDDATDKTVTWKSSDISVATVSNGKVTAVKEGTAKITATAGGKDATCDVTVTKKPEVIINPESITIPASETLKLNQSKNLTATLAPEGATGTVTWTSSAADVVKVENGKITALKVGTANITASIGELTSNTCAVTVEAVPLNGIAINPAEAEVEIAGTKDLTVVYDPADTTDDKTVTWSSSENAIATVVDGKVTGAAEDEATITAKVGDKEATCKIKVVKAPEAKVTGVSLDKSSISIAVGGEETLKAKVTATGDSANKGIIWSSSDESVAKVDKFGKVTGVAKGTATITVTTDDGGFTAECKVSVMTEDEYNEYVKTADPSLYAIALAIAVMSVMAMAVLIIVKRRQSVR